MLTWRNTFLVAIYNTSVDITNTSAGDICSDVRDTLFSNAIGVVIACRNTVLDICSMNLKSPGDHFTEITSSQGKFSKSVVKLKYLFQNKKSQCRITEDTVTVSRWRRMVLAVLCTYKIGGLQRVISGSLRMLKK